MWSTLFFRRVNGVCCFLLLLLAACAPEKETNVLARGGASLAEATTISTVTTPLAATDEAAPLPAIPTVPLPEPSPSVATATPVATFAPDSVPTAVATLPADLPVIAPENASGLTELARFGKGRIESIAWSPDGATFAVAGPTGVYLYDAATLQEVANFGDGGQGAIYAARFSPQGDVLALLRCSGGDCFVELWQTVGGQLIRTFSTLDQLPIFTTDGQTIIFMQSADPAPLVWQDVYTGETQHTVQLEFLQCCVHILSPGGEMLAELGATLQTVRVWDTASGQLRYTIEAPSIVNGVAFGPQGDLLAVNSAVSMEDNVIRLWDGKSGQLLHVLEGPTGLVGNIVFSPDGRILALGSADNRMVQLWDTASGQLLHLLTNNSGEPVAFSPAGGQLAVVTGGSREGGGSKVLFYDIETGHLLRTLVGYNNTMGVAFTPDGNDLIAVGGYEAQTWDVHSGQLRQTQTSDIPIWSMALSPDGQLMAWGGGKHQYDYMADEQLYLVQMWDVATGQPLYTVQEQDGVVFQVLFSPDGQLLATWNDVNSLVKVRQASTGELLFSRHASSVAFHPNNRLFAIDAGDLYGEGEASLQLWDLDTFTLVRTLPGLFDPVTFNADGHVVASGPAVTTGLWRTDTGDLLLPFSEEDVGMVYDPRGAALSPDGQILALRNRFDSLELWDMSTGQVLWASDHVTSVAFSPDGRLLATGNRDGTLSVWGLRP
jgi:WD40 repeat protein